MDDGQLIGQAAQGDASAFEAIVRRHVDSVWRLAHSFTHDDAVAEAVVHQTFVTASRALDAGGAQDSVATWLLSICHACRDEFPSVERRADRPVDDRPNAPGLEADLQSAVELARRSLPTDENEAFMLVEVLGHTRREAAAIVGVRERTMLSRVSSAREKLAKALGDARQKATGE